MEILHSLVVVFIMLAVSACGQQMAVEKPADSTLDLYLLIGQSNMAGRGKVTGTYTNDGTDDVMMLNEEGQWVNAKHPLHFDKPAVAGVGPGLRFGLEMAKAAQHKIGLIPCAVGGTSINKWVPGSYDGATKTHPFDDAMQRLDIALQSGRLKGVSWLQGESDSDSAKSVGYLEKLIELIGRIRRHVNNDSLPVVVGELGRYKSQYDFINRQLAYLPTRLSCVAVATSEGLVHGGDGTHLDAASADEYGRRFAEKMKMLLHQLQSNK